MCYRHEPYVARAVRSALRQQGGALDILISDDASDDGTFAAIEQAVAGYAGPHRVRLNRNDANMGMAHFNRILELAEGEYIVIAHGDDYSNTERTQTLMEIFEREGVSMISSNCQVMDREGRPLGNIGPPESHRMTLDSLIDAGWRPTMLGASHAIHRDVLARFGGVDPRWLPISYDLAFPFRGALLNGAYYCATELVAWRRHGRNMTDRIMRTTKSPAEQAEGLASAYMTELTAMLRDLAIVERGDGERSDLAQVRRRLDRTLRAVLQGWMIARNRLLAAGMQPEWVPVAELSDEALGEYSPDRLNRLIHDVLRMRR
jgi:glycosyltransferase involved in cell wall biosynthesis